VPDFELDLKLSFHKGEERVSVFNLLVSQLGLVLVLSHRIFAEANLVIFQELLNLLLHKRDQSVVVCNPNAFREKLIQRHALEVDLLALSFPLFSQSHCKRA